METEISGHTDYTPLEKMIAASAAVRVANEGLPNHIGICHVVTFIREAIDPAGHPTIPANAVISHGMLHTAFYLNAAKEIIRCC